MWETGWVKEKCVATVGDYLSIEETRIKGSRKSKVVKGNHQRIAVVRFAASKGKERSGPLAEYRETGNRRV